MIKFLLLLLLVSRTKMSKFQFTLTIYRLFQVQISSFCGALASADHGSNAGGESLNELTTLSSSSLIENDSVDDVDAGKYHCVQYGQCDTSQVGKEKNCQYYGPAKPLIGDEYLTQLQELCPQFVTTNSSTGQLQAKVCCDPLQVKTFYGQVSLLNDIFGRLVASY